MKMRAKHSNDRRVSQRSQKLCGVAPDWRRCAVVELRHGVLRRDVQTRFVRSAGLSLAIPALWSLVSVCVLGAQGWSAPSIRLWQEIQEDAIVATPQTRPTTRPTAYRVFELDERMLQGTLADAPLEFTARARNEELVMPLPSPNGGLGRFRIEESPILSPELANARPDIKTYAAYGIDDPSATGRLDRTPDGFHAMIVSTQGTIYVDPFQTGDTKHYITYAKKDFPAPKDPFRCLAPGNPVVGQPGLLAAPSGAILREYRIAITATGEYTTHFGGVATAQNQITTTINRVNEIYIKEVSIRFTIVAFNIYPNPATDPFPTGGNVDGALLSQNQTDLDAVVGAANYDIGHLFSQGGGGGLAATPSVCTPFKAMGATSRPNPSGDPFDVDYVAHEIGHQCGANHTFNGTTGACGGGNRNQATAVEPGSGSTIMAYAGICGAEDLQPNSDAYFHTISFDEITNYRDAGGACRPGIPTGNTPPNVDGGVDITIPPGTPFTLTATGNDPDGDPVWYCWEQIDTGTASPPPNNADGPLFRSKPPVLNSSRTFNELPLAWEHLPTVDRVLTFRVTARDDRGGVNYDTVNVTVQGAGGAITGVSDATVQFTLQTTGGNYNTSPELPLLRSPDFSWWFLTDGGPTILPSTSALGSLNYDWTPNSFTVQVPGRQLFVTQTIPNYGTATHKTLFDITFDLNEQGFPGNTFAGSYLPSFRLFQNGFAHFEIVARFHEVHTSFQRRVCDPVTLLPIELHLSTPTPPYYIHPPGGWPFQGGAAYSWSQLITGPVGTVTIPPLSTAPGEPALIGLRMEGEILCQGWSGQPVLFELAAAEGGTPTSITTMMVDTATPTANLGSCDLAENVCEDMPESACVQAGGTWGGSGSQCNPFPQEYCGDGILQGGEDCDGASDGACPNQCRLNCTCPPAEDVDGDGVPYAEDNCPDVANPGQEDYDDDGLGDLCDLCADVPDDPQGDSDLDGIGDSCDPAYLSCCPSCGTADYDWTLASTGNPNLTWGHKMAYDAERRVTVLFGGGLFGVGTVNHTWVWDGAAWTQKFPEHSPSPRLRHAMTYDPLRKKVVLFGGQVNSNTFLNETWEWDGNDWTQRDPVNRPSPRNPHGMAFDAARGVVVLFGGWQGGSTYADDTWTWDGSNWTQKSTANPPIVFEAPLAFDALRQVVVTGGRSRIDFTDQTWEWDGANWSRRPVDSPSGYFSAHNLAYDSIRGQTVMYGTNAGGRDDMWVYDGHTWESIPATAAQGGGFESALVFDESRGRLVFLGRPITNETPRTWEFPSQAQTRHYVLQGQPAGVGWSWWIHGADTYVTDLSVPGVPQGESLYVLGRAFADSINAKGCPDLRAVAVDLPNGNVLLNVTVGSDEPFDLCLGSESQFTSCCVAAAGGCSFNPQMEEIVPAGADCNRNGVDDAIELAGGQLHDANQNGIADECEAPPPQLGNDGCIGGANAGFGCTQHADCPGGFCQLKNRFITVSIPTTATAHGIKVSLVNLDANSVAVPSDYNGAARWVDAPTLNVNDGVSPSFHAANLQCAFTPQNWSAIGTVHLYGDVIVPGSTYDVSVCSSAAGPCSPALRIGTAKFGDVVTPVNTVNFQDVNAIVAKFQGNQAGPSKTRTKLTGSVVNPLNPINFQEVSACVSAFQGKPFKSVVTTPPTICP